MVRNRRSGTIRLLASSPLRLPAVPSDSRLLASSPPRSTVLGRESPLWYDVGQVGNLPATTVVGRQSPLWYNSTLASSPLCLPAVPSDSRLLDSSPPRSTVVARESPLWYNGLLRWTGACPCHPHTRPPHGFVHGGLRASRASEEQHLIEGFLAGPAGSTGEHPHFPELAIGNGNHPDLTLGVRSLLTCLALDRQRSPPLRSSSAGEGDF